MVQFGGIFCRTIEGYEDGSSVVDIECVVTITATGEMHFRNGIYLINIAKHLFGLYDKLISYKCFYDENK
jgi:hypothetical protein